MNRLCILGVFVALAHLTPYSQAADSQQAEPEVPELRVLVWAGYHRLIYPQKSEGKQDGITSKGILVNLPGTGKCKVLYEEYKTSADLVRRLQSTPGLYDIVLAHNHDLAKLISLDLVSKLPTKKLDRTHTFYSRLSKAVTTRNSAYVVPYLFATNGLLYRKDLIPVATSWRVLFNPEEASQTKRALLRSPDTLFPLVLLYLKTFSQTPTAEQVKQAGIVLYRMKARELIGALCDSTSDLAQYVRENRVSAAIIDSGSALQLERAMPNKLAFTIPEEGGEIYIDGFSLLAGSNRPDLACAYINHQLTPEIQAANALYQFYGCPNLDTLNLIKKIAPEQVKNKVIYPESTVFSRLYCFPSATPQEQSLWKTIFR